MLPGVGMGCCLGWAWGAARGGHGVSHVPRVPCRSISSVKGELLPYLVRHQSLEATPPAATPTSEGGRGASKQGSLCTRQYVHRLSSEADSPCT